MAIDGRCMFLTCKYAIEQMLTTGGGSIVCRSSISGVAGQARQSTYGPAKFVACVIRALPAPRAVAEHLEVGEGTALYESSLLPGTRTRCRSTTTRPGSAATASRLNSMPAFTDQPSPLLHRIDTRPDD
jgi:hypothetical protein